jgi:hypothetical protein
MFEPAKKPGQSKLLFNIILLLFANILLILIVSVLFISRNGIAPIISGLSPISSEEVREIKLGNKADLRSAEEKIKEFNESSIEKLELKFSEEEANALIAKYVEMQKKLKTQDKPSEKTLKKLNLQGFTDLFSGNLNAHIKADFMYDSAKVYVSYDGGHRYSALTVSQKDKKSVFIEDIELWIPGFLKEFMLNQMNIGLEDALIDFQEKSYSKRKITEVKFSRDSFIVVGERSD